MRIKSGLLLTFFVLLGMKANSQSVEFTGLKKISKGAVQTISVNNVVKGYYAFFLVDKKDRKSRHYQLQIFDNNLKATHKIDMVKSKNTFLTNGEFNGSHFCFLFVNTDEKEDFQELVFYDVDGNETGSYIYGTKKENFTYSLSEDSPISQSMTPIPGLGFILIKQDRNTGIKSTLMTFDNEGNLLWESESLFGDETSYEDQSIYYAGEKYIFTSCTARPRMMSTKGSKTEFTIYNAKDGSVSGEFKLNEGSHALSPYGAKFFEETDRILIYGEYYGRNRKGAIDLKNKLGFFIREHKPDGELVSENYTSWENDLKPIIPDDPEEKKSDKMSIYVHNIVRTKDGNYYAIAEQFRKVVSAGGIAMNMFNAAMGSGQGASNMQINLYDMMIMSFDGDLEPIEIELVDKRKTRVLLPPGYGAIQKDKLAHFIAVFGWFDYCFTTVNADNSKFNSAYVNFDRKGNKKNKSKYTIGNIALNDDNEIETVKINLGSKPTFFIALPAKPGYIAVFEYHRKEKTGTIKLEKLDI